jgi:ubiquinone/menaquinone biosynthesis C-methylase UbiE
VVRSTTDRTHLRHQQYSDASKLEARIALHQRFSTNAQGWFRWLFAFLPADERLRALDLGCGPASLWRSNAAQIPRHASIQLCDLSPGMLREASRALASDARFRFAAGDAQALPLADAGFDCVLANAMLYHVPDRQRALGEIARVLAPDGRLVASTVGERHLEEIDALLIRLGVGEDRLGRATSQAFTLENGAAQLAEHFDDVRLHRYHDALVVTEAAPLVAYLRSMLAGHDAVRARFEREVVRSIERDGEIRITKDSGVFTARRR